jgi:hypothetical protein
MYMEFLKRIQGVYTNAARFYPSFCSCFVILTSFWKRKWHTVMNVSMIMLENLDKSMEN